MYKNYSVLMSVYYKEKSEYLRESIESMMNQTIVTDDFVIVCDGPLTNELDLVINEFTMKYPDIFNVVRLPENVGVGEALSKVLFLCQNELIARMDSDDISISDRCEQELECFNRYNVDIVSGTVWEFEGSIDNLTVKRILPQNHDDIVKFAKRRNPFSHPSIMFRKSKALECGGYKPFHLCEDYYLWIRMLMNGAIGYNIQKPILYMRSGDGMYDRRSGFLYLKSMLRFRKYMYHVHFSSFKDLVISSTGQCIVCLSPKAIRKLLYYKLLRKK